MIFTHLVYSPKTCPRVIERTQHILGNSQKYSNKKAFLLFMLQSLRFMNKVTILFLLLTTN